MAVETVDLATDAVRELNQHLHDLDREPAPLAGDQPQRRPRGRGRDRRRREVEIDGHVGYYCAGMNKLATVRVAGQRRPGAAENMMSGALVVEGDASQSAAATAGAAWWSSRAAPRRAAASR